MNDEINKLHMDFPGVVVVTRENYGDMSISSIFRCLSKCFAVVNFHLPFDFRMNTGDPNHIRLFLAPSPGLAKSPADLGGIETLYGKLFQELSKLSSEFTFSPLSLQPTLFSHDEESI